ncbi:MAG: acyl-CoA thioesterase [Synergistaceae bacterium]|nr:acyl-CoA thioesterase [Synergistaceae bacterium]
MNDIKHTAIIRVRYSETDKMGVAYHGRYLDWFEVGRNEYCRLSGKSYLEWEAEGIMLPVVEAHCRYKSSLRYDDEAEIETRVSKLTRVSVEFSYRILNKATGKLAAEGYTKHAFVDLGGKLLKSGCALEEYLRKITEG